MKDLISFEDSNDDDAPTTISPTSHKSIENLPRPAHRDSFSDLADLMKAKRPYLPISTLGPRIGSPIPINKAHLPSRQDPSSSVLSPLASPYRNRDFVSTNLGEQQASTPSTSDLLELERQQQNIQPLNNLLDKELHSDFERNLTLHESGESRSESSGYMETIGTKMSTTILQDYSRRQSRRKLEEKVGRLHFWNETDKDQKSTMSHSMSLMNEQIRALQVENKNLKQDLVGCDSELKKLGGLIGENEYLRATLTSMRNSSERAPDIQIGVKEENMREAQSMIQKLEDRIKHLEEERVGLMRASENAEKHKIWAQTLSGTLEERENVIAELRLEQVKEQMRGVNLEEEVNELKEKVNQQNDGELKERLQKKTTQCHELNTKLKVAEQELKLSQERVLKVGNIRESLRNAAHLVRPNPNTKLPKKVFSCIDCYANNLECDNHAQCRNCMESNTECRRWRCSLKHRLGECPVMPCKPPHDAQGWLYLQERRPEW